MNHLFMLVWLSNTFFSYAFLGWVVKKIWLPYEKTFLIAHFLLSFFFMKRNRKPTDKIASSRSNFWKNKCVCTSKCYMFQSFVCTWVKPQTGEQQQVIRSDYLNICAGLSKITLAGVILYCCAQTPAVSWMQLVENTTCTHIMQLRDPFNSVSLAFSLSLSLSVLA